MKRLPRSACSWIIACNCLSIAFSYRYKIFRHNGALLALFLCLPSYVHGACVPLTQAQSEPSLLEQLAAKRTSTDEPLSDTDLRALLHSGDVKLPSFSVFPPNGPAPLTVNIQ
jgi:hypothetical protein